jgi:hypothetical protein
MRLARFPLMNSFHYSGMINGCLVNGSSFFLIKSYLSWKMNCLHAFAAVFQKSLNVWGFASYWNFKCFWQLQRYLSYSNKPRKRLEPALLTQWYWHPPMSALLTIIVSLGHFVDILGALPRRWSPPTLSCCEIAVPWPSFLSCGLGLYPSSDLSRELIIKGFWERSAQCPRIAQKGDHTASSPRRHATSGDK